jgi:hypothetical protein
VSAQEEVGTFRCYQEKRFGPDALAIIGKANEIILDYEGQGFGLTLRQLYYQFVARGLLANSDKNYDRLGNLISDGRMAGLVSWTAIEDRGRSLMGLNFHSGPDAAVKEARSEYRIDMWANQEWRPEVWVEKQALEGVIGSICNELRVNFFATKGYNSMSEQWRAGRRFAGYIHKGQRPIIFHLGDHDPSGLDMTRDNRDRLSIFAGVPIQVMRLALNMDQVQHYNPPPNPAKITDSRAADYIARFGNSSWELDALDPPTIHNLIRDAVEKIKDRKLWDEKLAEENEHKDRLDIIIEELGGGE